MKFKLLTFAILLFCLKIQGQQNIDDPVQVKIIGDTLVDAEGKTVLINDPKRKNGIIVKMFSLHNELKSTFHLITSEKQIKTSFYLKLVKNHKLILDGDSVVYNDNDTVEIIFYAHGYRFVKKEDVFYVYAEIMPEYPGGMDSLMNYLRQNTIYPNDAQKKGISGRVYVQFVIDTDGSLQKIKVIRGVYPSLDAEAIRVIRNMPPWIPGKHDGEKVKVQMSVPINFLLK